MKGVVMPDDTGALTVEEAIAAIPVPPPGTETEATEEVTNEVEQTEPTGEEQTTEEVAETEEVTKKGANARIRELNTRAKTAEAKVQSLSERLAELTGSVEPQGQVPQIPQFQPEPLVRPGEELTAEELEKRLQARDSRLLQQSQALSQLYMAQEKAINRINSEAEKAMGAYPELDPESEHFDQELSEAVYEAVEAKVKSDPYKASVKGLVDKLMQPYRRSVVKEVGKERENIAKQVSQTALRPTSIKSAEKSADEKSIEELERELGVVTY